MRVFSSFLFRGRLQQRCVHTSYINVYHAAFSLITPNAGPAEIDRGGQPEADLLLELILPCFEAGGERGCSGKGEEASGVGEEICAFLLQLYSRAFVRFFRGFTVRACRE